MSNTEDNAQSQARAQVASIVEMVAALSVDYARLEELRDKAKAGHFVAGWNMPGYMPDSEPAAFDDVEDARGYIASSMEDDAESNEDEGARVELESCAAAIRRGDYIGDAFGRTIGKFHYWITHEPGKLSEEDERKELAELEEEAGDCTSEEDARERIEQDALSVEIRSGWTSDFSDMSPEEFRIVLCTGGPHVELVGDLDEHRQPSRVRVLYRDWGMSGELFDFDREPVLTYCQQFYFGE